MKDRHLRSCFMVCFAAILTMLILPRTVDAVIGNCHSYTYWMLSGDEHRDVDFNRLQTLLRRMMYEGVSYGPNAR
ncbi:MAG: hypothetical protein KJN62_07780, partial [Deltaproteobacteria bacterium]|nr:hypothetical protein [Deltaproteobacteria bacterium]